MFVGLPYFTPNGPNGFPVLHLPDEFGDVSDADIEDFLSAEAPELHAVFAAQPVPQPPQSSSSSAPHRPSASLKRPRSPFKRGVGKGKGIRFQKGPARTAVIFVD
jgi:hypothetical protein